MVGRASKDHDIGFFVLNFRYIFLVVQHWYWHILDKHLTMPYRPGLTNQEDIMVLLDKNHYNHSHL